MLYKDDAYHRMFVDEAEEQILQLQNLILSLYQKDVSDDQVHLMFRVAHSLKGATATLNISSMVELTHRLEHIFDLKRKMNICFSEIMIDMMLSITDYLKKIHETLYKESTFEVDEALRIFLEEIDVYLPVYANQKEEKPYLEGHILTLDFEDDASMLCVKAYMIIDLLKDQLTIVKTNPQDYEHSEDLDFHHKFELQVEAAIDVDVIKKCLEPITDIKNIFWTQEEPKEKDEVQMIPTKIQSIKVPIEQVDRIISLTERLVILQEKMAYEMDLLKAEFKKDYVFHNIQKVQEDFNDQIAALRQLSVDTRMVPIEMIFRPLPRYLKKLTDNQDKEIELKLTGGDTGVDKKLIELLNDPLQHMIRNAVDHGFENSRERITKGKAAIGCLEINATQNQNQLILEIKDDGKGIDINTIKKKALSRNQISIEEAEYMTHQDWLDLIFKPGFSTKDIVNEVSGRGVGLDVVKDSILKLNGSIEMETSIGVGTTFFLKIPLTLSIMDCFILAQDNCLYGVPESMVLEVLSYEPMKLKESVYLSAYGNMFSWKDNYIPYLKLSEYYNLKPRDLPRYMHLCVVGLGDKKIALQCDEILGKKSLVMSSVGDLVGEDKILGRRNDLLGLSSLGDERLVQVLEISYFLKEKG
ncbi:MAG: Hpt domain-containing protein [Clostridia bacterium]|nr:Hpt domain-containing protein [Clostridia bacterium]